MILDNGDHLWYCYALGLQHIYHGVTGVKISTMKENNSQVKCPILSKMKKHLKFLSKFPYASYCQLTLACEECIRMCEGEKLPEIQHQKYTQVRNYNEKIPTFRSLRKVQP